MPQLVEAQVAHVDAADEHPAAGDVVEARDERGERGLARPDAADQRHRLARLDVEVDAAQHVDVGVGVAEVDVLEHAAWCRSRPRTGLGRVEDRRLGVEHLEDAPARRWRPPRRARAASRAMMIGQIRLQVQRDERDELRRRVIAPCAMAYTPPTVTQASTSCGWPFEQRPEQARACGSWSARPLRSRSASAREAGQHVRAAAVGLDHPDAERGLLDGGREVAGEVLRAAGVAAVAQLEAAGERSAAAPSRRARTSPSQSWMWISSTSTTTMATRVGEEEDGGEARRSGAASTGRWSAATAAGPTASGRGRRPAAAAGGRTGRGAGRSRSPSAAMAIARRRSEEQAASATPNTSASPLSAHRPAVSWWRIGPSTTRPMTSGTRDWASIAPVAVATMTMIGPAVRAGPAAQPQHRGQCARRPCGCSLIPQ